MCEVFSNNRKKRCETNKDNYIALLNNNPVVRKEFCTEDFLIHISFEPGCTAEEAEDGLAIPPGWYGDRYDIVPIKNPGNGGPKQQLVNRVYVNNLQSPEGVLDILLHTFND